MLNEYAVEPSLLNTWAHFRYFIEKFGVSHGRFISRFPKTWKRMVYESLSACGDLDRKRIELRLQQIDDRLLPRLATYDGSVSWLENAEVEHTAKSFHAIIARANPRGRAFVLDGGDLDETHSLWQSSGSIVVDRKAKAMANAMSPLLEACSEVVFVDPHFGPENRRHRVPFEAFMAALNGPRRCRRLERIEYHTSDKATAAFFQSECRRILPQLIPLGLTVRLVRWHKGELHNRFILTDVGGVLVGQGLDESDGAGPATDDYSRLDEAALQMRWAEFVTGSATKIVDDLTIVGTKP